MEEKIPEGVVDKEAYLEYKRLEKNPLLNEKKEIVCSDNTVVSIALFPHLLLKKVEHLPIEEQNRIMTKKQLYFKVNNKLNALKRKAYGSDTFRKGVGLTTSEINLKKPELIALFGRMFSVDEVFTIINKDWGLQISKDVVKKFRLDNSEEISKEQEKFKASYADIRLGHKRSRLEELTWLYARQKEKFNEKFTDKDSYKLLLNTLEQIRKEAEGDRLTIDGKIDVNYEANIQVHLREEVYKTLNIKEIILGRVASRMNIKPSKLIYSLNNSFYAKFSNVLGTFNGESKDNDEVIYPSQMNYDFERINREFNKRDKEIQEAEIIEETKDKKDLTRAEIIKQEMLERLKGNKDKVDKMRSEVIGRADASDKNINKDKKVKKK